MSSAMPEATQIIAIVNQKGGVGKTTTAINLGAALARSGSRVLLVDLDPQGNASTGLGLFPEDRDLTTFDLLQGVSPETTVRETGVSSLWIIPSTTDLAGADVTLSGKSRRSYLLRDALYHPALTTFDFDYILIDCPPSLSILTVNALVAAQSVIVPLQSEFFALEGLSQLMLTIRDVREAANPGLRIRGVVLTMFDGRNNLSQQVEADARANLGDLVFRTRVPRNVRLSEAPSFAMPVLDYDASSTGSQAYINLAAEILAQEN